MKLKSFLLAAVSAFVPVSAAKADGVETDKFVLSDGSSAVMFGLNEWLLASSEHVVLLLRPSRPEDFLSCASSRESTPESREFVCANLPTALR